MYYIIRRLIGNVTEVVCIIKGLNFATQYCDLMNQINKPYKYSYESISVYGIE